MKLAVTVLTALVAFATVNAQNAVPDFGQGPLHDDIQYFLNMIPMKQVEMVITRYTIQDPEFRDALSYMLSNEFKNLVIDVEHVPEVLVFLQFLEDSGIYAYDLVNQLNVMLGIHETLPAVAKTSYLPATNGLAGFFTEVKALISYDQFIHGYAYKMKTSPAFVAFVEQLKSSNFQGIVNNIYAHPTYLNVRSNLVAAGVNVKLVEDIMFTVLGTQFPDLYSNNFYESALSKDFEDFQNLAFTEEVMNIFMKYFTQDPEVQRGFEYMQNPEFHTMVRNVEALPEYQAFVQYLESAGVDVVNMIQQFHDFAGMEPYVPPMYTNQKYQSLIGTETTGGFRGLIDELKAALPRDDLYALYQYKLQTSPAFADFIAHIQSPEFQNIINMVYAHPIFIEMRTKALIAGLDLAAFDELITLIFGIQMPQP